MNIDMHQAKSELLMQNVPRFPPDATAASLLAADTIGLSLVPSPKFHLPFRREVAGKQSRAFISRPRRVDNTNSSKTMWRVIQLTITRKTKLPDTSLAFDKKRQTQYPSVKVRPYNTELELSSETEAEHLASPTFRAILRMTRGGTRKSLS